MPPPVMRFPPRLDLAPLRRALWSARINHYYREDGEGQWIVLTDATRLAEARELAERWQAGERLDVAVPPKAARGGGRAVATLSSAPLTTALVAVCVVIFLLMQGLQLMMVEALAIAPLTFSASGVGSAGLGATLASGQLWRLFTPALMHFGVSHLVFNLMWVWYFGRQIELRGGTLALALLVAITALVGNLAQYAAGGLLFGGMSGVVYGLLGYVWLRARQAPASGYHLPQMLMLFMLGWLVLCMTPLAVWIGFGNVANEAHLGGLLAGLAAALAVHARAAAR